MTFWTACSAQSNSSACNPSDHGLTSFPPRAGVHCAARRDRLVRQRGSGRSRRHLRSRSSTLHVTSKRHSPPSHPPPPLQQQHDNDKRHITVLPNPDREPNTHEPGKYERAVRSDIRPLVASKDRDWRRCWRRADSAASGRLHMALLPTTQNPGEQTANRRQRRGGWQGWLEGMAYCVLKL